SGMGDIHAAQYVVASLNVDPATQMELRGRRFNNLALKGPVNGPDGDTKTEEQADNDSDATKPHVSTMQFNAWRRHAVSFPITGPVPACRGSPDHGDLSRLAVDHPIR